MVVEVSEMMKHPKYGLLFQQIVEKLGPDFIHKEIKEEAKISQMELKESMQHYFKQYILMDNTMKAINEIELSQKEEATLLAKFSTQSQVSSLLIHPLYFKSVQNYLIPNDSANEIKLLGLDQSDVSKRMKNIKLSEEDSKLLSTTTEEHIQKFCNKVVEYVGYTSCKKSSPRKAFNETMKYLSTNAILLDPKFDETSDSSLEELLNTYQKELLNSLFLLKKILKMILEKFENEAEHCHFFHRSLVFLQSKMRFMLLHLLASTYDKHKVLVLKRIRSQMETEEESLHRQRFRLSSILAEYEDLDPEYCHYVDEYTQLLEKLQTVEWSVASMKERKEAAVPEKCVLGSRKEDEST